MTTRRGFLGSLLALGVAPAIVRADSIMKIAVPRNVELDNLCAKYEHLWLEGGGDPGWVMRHQNEDDRPWTLSETKVESQITADKWFTPPEIQISARPFIPGDELNGVPGRGFFFTEVVSIHRVNPKAARAWLSTSPRF